MITFAKFNIFASRAGRAGACAALLGLGACNDPGSLIPTTGGDVDSGGGDSTTNPQPTPTVTATPSPTPKPTPSPTPKPTATPTPTSDLYTGPAEVAKYVQKFVDDGKAQGVDVIPDMKGPKLTIQIASLSSYGSSTIGLCETGGGLRRVTFSPSFWNSVSETQRELLAHHEFGHCVLYRAHRSTTLSSGAYASVMYPIIMSSSAYLNNYAYYQEELFTQSLQGPMNILASGAGPADGDQVTTHICDESEVLGAQ